MTKFAIANDPTVVNWPTQIQESIADLADQGVEYAQDSLLSQVNNISIYNRSFGKNPLKSTSIGLKAYRTVYDNQDIKNTWTVVDSYQFLANSPARLFAPIPLGPTGLNANFNINGNAGFNLINMRILEPKKIKEIPSIEEEVKKLETTIGTETEDTNSESDSDISVLKPDKTLFYEWDSNYPPIFRKYYKLFTFPWKIPFNAKRADKLENGEIFSFNANGTVQLGASLGWGPVKIRGTVPSIGVSAVFLLKGDFRISIMKESERWVRVKLSKTSVRSKGAGLGVSSGKVVLFEGVNILNYDTYGTTDFTIAPFRFNVGAATAKQFDLYYRYDLNSDEGREAYNKAVLGLFKLSEDIEEEHKKQGTESPVQKIVKRNLKSKSVSSSISTALDVVGRGSISNSHIISTGTIELPDGTHEIFKFVKAKSSSFSTFWNSDERNNFNVVVNFDEFKFKKGDIDSYSIELNGQREDHRSSGIELNKMISEAEEFTGTNNIFPKFSKYFPIPNDKNLLRKAFYGYSSFNFGIIINQKQIEMILKLPEDVINAALEKTVPKAEWFKIKNNLKKAREETSMTSKLSLIAKAFTRPNKNLNYSKFVRLLLIDQEIDYHLFGSNRRFGVINNRGKTISKLDEIMGKSQNELFADREGPHFVGDFYTLVGGLKMVPIETEIKNNSDRKINDYKLNIKLNSIPKSLALKFTKSSRWGRYRELESFLIDNKNGLLKKGVNVFLIAPDAPTILGRLIFNHLKRGQYYTLEASVSNAKDEWSRTSTTEFYVPLDILNTTETLDTNN